MRTCLVVERRWLTDGAAAFLRRMELAQVPVVPFDPPFSARALLGAVRQAGAEGGWLVCGDPGAVAAAATAGLAGVVLLDAAPPADDHGITVAAARDLADAPRVMVPRDGGCWHDHGV